MSDDGRPSPWQMVALLAQERNELQARVDALEARTGLAWLPATPRPESEGTYVILDEFDLVDIVSFKAGTWEQRPMDGRVKWYFPLPPRPKGERQ